METRKNISNRLKLHSDSVQKILSTPPHWMIRWGNTFVFLILLFVILMSYFIKYPKYIQAPIIVTSKNLSEKTQAKTTSKIETLEIFVGKIPILLADYHKITPGQKVLMKFSNYPYQEYGIVEGKVQNITKVPDKTGKYYVEVSLPKGLKTSYNKNLLLDNELKGEAKIMIKDVRLIERFFHTIK